MWRWQGALERWRGMGWGYWAKWTYCENATQAVQTAGPLAAVGTLVWMLFAQSAFFVAAEFLLNCIFEVQVTCFCLHGGVGGGCRGQDSFHSSSAGLNMAGLAQSCLRFCTQFARFNGLSVHAYFMATEFQRLSRHWKAHVLWPIQGEVQRQGICRCGLCYGKGGWKAHVLWPIQGEVQRQGICRCGLCYGKGGCFSP